MQHNLMDWHKLISKSKLYPSSVRVNEDNDRSEFERDHNKIIFSPHFRQLQNKTQLFPQPGTDFIHTRLTHSLEVASVGKSLGNLVAKRVLELHMHDNNVNIPTNFSRDVSDIVGAACLLHDIGNPPFGHSGEDAISAFFIETANLMNHEIGAELVTQLSNFDGNAQSLRIIKNAHNLNLTVATIGSMIKYPTNFATNRLYKNKFSIFNTELKVLERVATECGLIQFNNSHYCRHPLTFLVEAADDICYRLLDLEDAHKVGLISFNDAEQLLLQLVDNHKNLSSLKESIKNYSLEDKFAKLRSYAINILIGEVKEKFVAYYSDIMSASYDRMIVNGKLCGLVDLIVQEDSDVAKSLQAISSFINNTVYSHKPILEIELAGYEVISFLLNQFIFATLDVAKQENMAYATKLLKLLPEQSHKTQTLTEKVMGVVDHIVSMTDMYAINLYQKLKCIKVSSIG